MTNGACRIRITMGKMRFLFGVVAALVFLAVSPGRTVLAQEGTALDEVRHVLDAARKDIAAYSAAGGRDGMPDHPAIKWSETLWAFRERYPNTDAAALASAEAVRLLVHAELWDRAHARLDSLGPDDPAWGRLAAVVYEESIERKDLPYAIERLSRVAASTSNASVKAPVLVIVGRAYRRQGDKEAATRALKAAMTAGAGTPAAEEADGLLYEIAHLSVGAPAPLFNTRARNGRAVSLAALRGKPVVLVFWGTT